MSDSQKPPREFWIDYIPSIGQSCIYDDAEKPTWSPAGEFVHVIEKSAYDQLMQQAQKMREALARYKGLCVHWDENHHETCGRPADRALEQFDAFMEKMK